MSLGEPFTPGELFSVAVARHVRAGFELIQPLFVAGLQDPKSFVRLAHSQGQGGAAPASIDRVIDAALRRHLGSFKWGNHPVVVAGEEDEHNAPVADLAPGTIYFNPDPLDGTTMFLALERHYSSNVVAYIVTPASGLHAVSAHILDPLLGRHYWWSDHFDTRSGDVFTGLSGDTTIASALESDPGDLSTWRVAGVASGEGRTREFFNWLTSDHGVKSFTVGGAPLVRSLVNQELTALVELKYSTVYDSCHLLLAHGLGLVVGDDQGRVYRRSELLEVFTGFDHPKDKIVPPYIVTDSHETYRAIIHKLETSPP